MVKPCVQVLQRRPNRRHGHVDDRLFHRSTCVVFPANDIRATGAVCTCSLHDNIYCSRLNYRWGRRFLLYAPCPHLPHFVIPPHTGSSHTLSYTPSRTHTLSCYQRRISTPASAVTSLRIGRGFPMMDTRAPTTHRTSGTAARGTSARS